MTASTLLDVTQLPTQVTVTADHIERGIRENCDSCPIALAIIEAIGAEPGSVSVTADWVHFYRNQDLPLLMADLPIWARNFVRAFDHGRKVRPFTFELTWREDTF